MAQKFIITPNLQNLSAATILARYAAMENVVIINGKTPPNASLPDKYSNQPGTQLNYTRDAPIGLSSLGTPIYTDLTLLGCSYTDPISGNVITLPNDRYRSGDNLINEADASSYTGGYYLNIENVLITINQPIKIVKTAIQGRPGTVKEYIGKDDTKITINGMLHGKNGVYPKDDVARLQAWLDAPVSRGITTWWLEIFKISQLVVENYDIPQVEGGYSYQMFTIDAISDSPAILQITQPATTPS